MVYNKMLVEYLSYIAYIPIVFACFRVGPLNILNYIARIFGYMYYTLKEQYNSEEIKNILKNLKHEVYASEYTLRNGNPRFSGFFFTRYCFGHYDGYDFWIYISEDKFNTISRNDTVKLTTDIVDNISPESTSKKSCEIVKVYDYNNSYLHSGFNVRNLNVETIHSNDEQHEIVESIYDIYKKKGRASIWIDGIPGSGKSTIGLLLAKKIHGNYCHTFHPLIPSMCLNNLCDDIDDTPMVIVIEEFDNTIKMIHENKVIRNERYHTMIYDKGSFNTFMDDVYLYPNIIFIFTSNVKKSEIDTLDASYLRKGRIHKYFTMNKVYDVE
jgi:hypothetical protein